MNRRNKTLALIAGGSVGAAAIAATAVHPARHTPGGAAVHARATYAAPLVSLNHDIPVPAHEGIPYRKVLGFRMLSAVPGYPLPGRPRIAAVTVEWQLPPKSLFAECIGGQFRGPGRGTWLQTSAGPVYPSNALMDATVTPMQKRDKRLWANTSNICAGYEVEVAPPRTVTTCPGNQVVCQTAETITVGVPAITGTLYYALPAPDTRVYGLVWSRSDWPAYEVANPQYELRPSP